jgi:serine/threonine protein phosphatase PrpC
LSIVTDGCGPGENSREAAQIAVAECSRYIRAKLSEAQTLKSLTKMVIDALEIAHQQLISKPETPKTTTITINIVFTASSGETYLLVVMLGDTKCYLTSLSETGRLVTVDLTQNTRFDFDVTDSGGALGGFYEDPRGSRNYIRPKLDNLSVICCLLPKTQQHFVMTATDGLTDCFDPEQLRMTVQQTHPLIPKFFARSWDDLPPRIRHKMIVKHSTELFSSIFARTISQVGGNLDLVCEGLTQFSNETTEAERDWMTKNPKRMPPKDDLTFRGKMDHTTMVCIMVPPKHFTSIDTSTTTSSPSSSSTTYSGSSSFAYFGSKD